MTKEFYAHSVEEKPVDEWHRRPLARARGLKPDEINCTTPKTQGAFLRQ